MKVFLAVWNNESKGKSSTLRAFAELLIDTYPDYKPVFSSPFVPENNDFVLVLEIKDRRIGCVSQANFGTGLGRKLIDLADVYNCDLIICSTGIRGDVIKAVDENIFCHRGFKTIWTSTYQMADPGCHSIVNKLKARHILELLQELKAV